MGSQEITDEELYIQSNWNWKKNKQNKPTYWSANKSLIVENFRPLFLTVFPMIVMGLVSMAAEKIR